MEAELRVERLSGSVSSAIGSERIKAQSLDVGAELLAVGASTGSLYLFELSLRCAPVFLRLLSCPDSSGSASLVRLNPALPTAAVALSSGSLLVLHRRSSALLLRMAGKARANSVTALCWSPDGAVLYSGYASGSVLRSRVSEKGALSQALYTGEPVYSGEDRIVQLSCSTDSAKLLISTTRKCIVVNFAANSAKSVGKKSIRKGPYGATFHPDLPSYLLSARPGHRLWLAKESGAVANTLPFADSLAAVLQQSQQELAVLPGSEAPLAMDVAPAAASDESEAAAENEALFFGQLLPLGHYLVSWSAESIHVISLTSVEVLRVLSRLGGPIVDCAVNETAIYFIRSVEGRHEVDRILVLAPLQLFDVLIEREEWQSAGRLALEHEFDEEEAAPGLRVLLERLEDEQMLAGLRALLADIEWESEAEEGEEEKGGKQEEPEDGVQQAAKQAKQEQENDDQGQAEQEQPPPESQVDNAEQLPSATPEDEVSAASETPASVVGSEEKGNEARVQEGSDLTTPAATEEEMQQQQQQQQSAESVQERQRDTSIAATVQVTASDASSSPPKPKAFAAEPPSEGVSKEEAELLAPVETEVVVLRSSRSKKKVKKKKSKLKRKKGKRGSRKPNSKSPRNATVAVVAPDTSVAAAEAPEKSAAPRSSTAPIAIAQQASSSANSSPPHSAVGATSVPGELSTSAPSGMSRAPHLEAASTSPGGKSATLFGQEFSFGDLREEVTSLTQSITSKLRRSKEPSPSKGLSRSATDLPADSTALSRIESFGKGLSASLRKTVGATVSPASPVQVHTPSVSAAIAAADEALNVADSDGEEKAPPAAPAIDRELSRCHRICSDYLQQTPPSSAVFSGLPFEVETSAPLLTRWCSSVVLREGGADCEMPLGWHSTLCVVYLAVTLRDASEEEVRAWLASGAARVLLHESADYSFAFLYCNVRGMGGAVSDLHAEEWRAYEAMVEEQRKHRRSGNGSEAEREQQEDEGEKKEPETRLHRNRFEALALVAKYLASNDVKAAANVALGSGNLSSLLRHLDTFVERLPVDSFLLSTCVTRYPLVVPRNVRATLLQNDGEAKQRKDVANGRHLYIQYALRLRDSNSQAKEDWRLVVELFSECTKDAPPRELLFSAVHEGLPAVDALNASWRWAAALQELVQQCESVAQMRDVARKCAEVGYWWGFCHLNTALLRQRAESCLSLEKQIAVALLLEDEQQLDYILELSSEAEANKWVTCLRTAHELACAEEKGSGDAAMKRCPMSAARCIEFMLERLGPLKSVAILRQCLDVASEIPASLYARFLSLGLVSKQQDAMVAEMLEAVDSHLWTKPDPNVCPQIAEVARCEAAGDFEEMSAFVDPNATLKFDYVTPTPRFWEDSDGHWGVRTNLRHSHCPHCSLPLIPAPGSAVSDIRIFPCGHAAHAECNSEEACTVCFAASLTSLEQLCGPEDEEGRPGGAAARLHTTFFRGIQ